jgi:iron complex transport system ATP-binding protein
LVGLLPAAGNITYNYTDWLGLGAEARARHMAYLPQESGVLFSLTVEELMDLSLDEQPPLTGEARARVLAATEMDSFLTRPYHALSGGEKRRAMLSRLLCRNVSLLLLDEPTAPLDMRHAALVMRYLRATPAAVLAAMHDLNLAVRHFDRFLLMKKGRILFDKHKDELDTAMLEEIYGLKLERYGNYFMPCL